MKYKLLVPFFVVVSCAATAWAGEIHVSAAASLKNALAEMIAVFSKDRPNSVVLTNFGASGSLAKQVVQGAPADLFISADEHWVEFLVSEGKAAADSKKLFAANTLVFVGRQGIAAGSLADLPKLERLAIGSPASVPAGRYAEQALRAAGVFEELAGKKKLVMAQDVRQALLYAERGEVDGAFVYATDARLAEQAKVLFEIPENLHEPIVYPMIMTQAGASRAEVREFFTWLTGASALAILQEYGFASAR